MLSSRISECIEQARCSPTRYASVDLFIGPYIGREIAVMRLQSLVEDIAAPQQFQSSQPVLAVRSTTGATKGFLLILGGGHRFMALTRVLHGGIIPYKLVDFSGITINGKEMDVVKHKGIIAFQVETNEPRPDRYAIMEQVLLYDDLKAHWRRLEDERVSKLKGRKSIPRKLTHPKLFEFYEATAHKVGAKSRWAIDFLSGKDSRNAKISAATRRQYMTGADRLLEAGVVPYLVSLEQDGLATFNRGSLYAVRKWSVEKIRQVVELWKVRQSTGVKVKYQFSDKIGRDVDGKGRGRKPSQKPAVVHEDEQCEDVSGEAAPPPEQRMEEINPDISKNADENVTDTQPQAHQETLDHGTLQQNPVQGMENDVPSTHGNDEEKRNALDDIMSRLDECVAGTQDVDAESSTKVLQHLEPPPERERQQDNNRKKMPISSLLGTPDCPNAKPPENIGGSNEHRSKVDQENYGDREAPEEGMRTAQNVSTASQHEKSQPCCPQQPSEKISENLCGNTNSKVVGVALDKLTKQKNLLGDSICDVDLETKIEIMKDVEVRIGQEQTLETVPLPRLLEESASALREKEKHEIKLVVEGGVLGDRFTLCEADLKPIRSFHIGNDRSIMFTLSFLTKWTHECASGSIVHDSVLTCGWWEAQLSEDTQRLEALRTRLKTDGAYTKRCREDMWRSYLCFMPICGRGHWSLIVILNLNRYFDEGMKEGDAGTSGPKQKPGILFIDSCGPTSVHKDVYGNVFEYLSSCCPHRVKPSPSVLKKEVSQQKFYVQLQQNMECGFFVGYHVSLVNKISSLMAGSSLRQIELLVKERGAAYTFQAYQDDVLKRLEHLLREFSERQCALSVPLWGWSADESVKPLPDTSNGVEEDKEKSDVRDMKLYGTLKRGPPGIIDERPLKRKGNEAAVNVTKENGVKTHPGTAEDLGETVNTDMSAQRKRSCQDDISDLGSEFKSHCTMNSCSTVWVSSFVLDLLEQVTREESRGDTREKEEVSLLTALPDPGLPEKDRICRSQSGDAGFLSVDHVVGSPSHVVVDANGQTSAPVVKVPHSENESLGKRERASTTGGHQKSVVSPWVLAMVTDIVDEVTQGDASEGKGRGAFCSRSALHRPDEKPAGSISGGYFPSERDTEKNHEVTKSGVRSAAVCNDGFIDIFLEAATLASKAKSRVIKEEWDVCRKQIYSLLLKMKAEQ